MGIKEKKQCIEKGYHGLSIKKQCDLISLPHSSYYREGLVGQKSPGNLEIMRLIDKEYMNHPFYGSRQMRNVLRCKGYKSNHKRVQRLMRKIKEIHCPQT